MDKFKVTLEHIYDDETRGFYVTYEIPSSPAESRELATQIKRLVQEDKLDRFGDCDTEELAMIFDVSKNTIMNWARRDGMPIVIKTSKGYRFNKEDVFIWVKAHKAHYIYLINRYEERARSQK